MTKVGNNRMSPPFTSKPGVGSGAGPAVRVAVAIPLAGRKRLGTLSDTAIGGTVVLPIGLPSASKLGGLAPTPDTALRPMVSVKPA